MSEIDTHNAAVTAAREKQAERETVAASYRTPDEAVDVDALKAEIAQSFANLAVVPTRSCDFEGSISPRMAAFGFPERYRVDGLMLGEDERIAEQWAVMGKIRKQCRGKGAIVAMVGPRGTGKTTIAAEIVAMRLWRELEIARLPSNQRTGVPCTTFRYAKVSDIVAKLKALYGDWGSTNAEKLERFRDWICEIDLLILDEWQECADDSKHKDRIMTDIMDRRYSALRDTIIISNQTSAEFEKSINPSLLSRLNQHGGIIACVWKSFREEPAK